MKVVVSLGNFCSARTSMSQGVELEVDESDLARMGWELQRAAKVLFEVEKGLAMVREPTARSDEDGK